jgi:hypothetical protein
MHLVRASASKTLAAPPERVLELLRDYHRRSEILTSNYTACRVEAGGDGDGTVFAYHFAAGGRERDYRLRVEEENGSLRERDQLSTFLSIWRVRAVGAEANGGELDGAGAHSEVSIEVSWQGAEGVGGFFERVFAPLGMQRILSRVLQNLATRLH